MNTRIYLGLLLTCLPLPMYLFSKNLLSALEIGGLHDQAVLFAVLFAGPALMLLFGYRWSIQRGALTVERFIQAAARVGFGLAALIVVPMAIPAMLYRPADMSLLESMLHVILMVMLSVLVSTGYAALFWIVSLRHLPKTASSDIRP